MTRGSERSLRRDAARNRETLLVAARTVFDRQGLDAPLENVAETAGVSRATLYRNFATREDLLAAIYEENVVEIEARAEELLASPTGIVKLFDLVLDMQCETVGIAQIFAAQNSNSQKHLGKRVSAAFGPLVEKGILGNILHPDVGMREIMLAYAMSEGVKHSADPAEKERTYQDARRMFHRALFQVRD